MKSINTKAGLIYQSTQIGAIDWLIHGFGSRSITLEKYLDALEVRDRYVAVTNQIHGRVVHCLLRPKKGNVLEGDAFITDRPGLVCFVRTADCTPIIVVDTKKQAVAAIHAGWRGTVQNIVGETVAAMTEVFGTRPKDCVASIGPRICGSCYEVGQEVVVEMEKLPIAKDWLVSDSHVDLGGANRSLLQKAGIATESLEVADECTCCNPTFASYRRDRSETERQFNFVVIK